MDPLLEVAKRHDLLVIEDAAQAIAARYRGRAAGSLGVTGCFSFYPTKNLGGAGDGGMITTNDAALAERLRSLRHHGTIPAGSAGSPGAGRHRHAHLGINSRLDTLQAAILLVKLRHLDAWTELRKTRAAIYRAAFLEAGLADPAFLYPTHDAPVVLPFASPHAEHVYHQFTVRVERRDELASYLAEQGIATGIYHPAPLHLQPAFTFLGGRVGDCPESERAAEEVLSLPLYPEMTEEQQARVVQTIEKFYGE
jgi:dTDP-4-amino-4,6-dideoxygalactose transaminase